MFNHVNFYYDCTYEASNENYSKTYDARLCSDDLSDYFEKVGRMFEDEFGEKATKVERIRAEKIEDITK